MRHVIYVIQEMLCSLKPIVPVGTCLFIYSLFNDSFSISYYIASNEMMIVNNELERMWKEAVVA
jgi:hypothetical protein